MELRLARCLGPGQRGGRPRCSACSLAQMVLQHTMDLARLRMRERVTLWHARNLSADRRSHPPRPHGWVVVRMYGPQHPADQEHSGASCPTTFWEPAARIECQHRSATNIGCAARAGIRQGRPYRGQSSVVNWPVAGRRQQVAIGQHLPAELVADRSGSPAESADRSGAGSTACREAVRKCRVPGPPAGANWQWPVP